MKYVGALLLTILIAASAALGQSVSITGPNRYALLEGKTYVITWKAEGIQSVNILVRGENTPLGADSRGAFLIIVAKSVPAEQGKVEWKVPWIDSRNFFVRVEGYDADGKQVDEVERGYAFRPAVLARRLKDGLYLDLHKRTDQRLYVQKGQKITHVYLSTSSHNYKWVPANMHPKDVHDHAGVFRVLSKEPSHWSREYQVDMRFAMRYVSGHFIHATFDNLYWKLGEPASSGCNRLTLRDARELYKMTPIGTRVEVIGPKG